MKLPRPILACLLVTLSLTARSAMPARADITLNVKMDMTIPQMSDPAAGSQFMRQMPFLNQLGSQNVYISGNKMRIDFPGVTTLVDLDAGTISFLDTNKHTYFTSAYSPERAVEAMAAVRGAGFSAVDTGRTTTVLGHKARHFVITFNMGAQGYKFKITQDILSAQDFAPADAVLYPIWLSGSNKITGIPLATTTNISIQNSSPLNVIVTTKVKKISTDPIPAAAFDIPNGYTQQTPQNPFTQLVQPSQQQPAQ